MTMGVDNVSNSDEVKTPSNGGLADPGCYRILVKGCLDDSWSNWFDSLAVVADSQCGQTAITGWLADQSALHGLLNKVRNLGLVLIAVTLVEADASAGGGVRSESSKPPVSSGP